MTAVRHITDAQRRHRLVRRHHLGRTAVSVERAVSDLVAMHSSDPATPYLGLWARVPGVTVAAVEEALYGRREVWRLHAMRRTLWIVGLADTPAVRGASTQAVAEKERRRLEGWVSGNGLANPGGWLRDLEEQVIGQLVEGEPLTTSALAEAIPDLATRVAVGSGKWATDVPVSSRLLFVMAMDGHIVRTRPLGTWRASQYGWVGATSWFQDMPAQPLSPPLARARLADRWLGRFGPATSDDLHWWMGWTKRKTAHALEACQAVAVEVDDGPAWLAAGDTEDDVTLDGEETAGVVTLLPALDPTAMGWKSRQWYLGEWATFGGPLFDRNGNVGPTVWIDGRVVGGWGQRSDGNVVTRLLADVGADRTRSVALAAGTLTDWLAPHVVIPRFRTPLEKELSAG